MAKKLVIVESPAKAKTINKILGGDYLVKSSLGHVRDLPQKTLGVDIKHGFLPHYVLAKGKRKVVEELKKTARDCDAVYLAPDPDREGEAIAWHLQALLSATGKDKSFFRVQYNEITPRAVRAAFQNPGEIDMKRVAAQQARRILDRIVGYTVSPMLWRRIGRGLSAGRVQSVALRLVCERENEIRNFVPEEYWIIGATVRKLIVPLDPFNVKLVRVDGEKADVRTTVQAEQIRADLEGRSLRVAKIKTREIKRRPPPPLITSTLQQAASNKLQFSPKRTMVIAQKLYEGVDLGSGSAGLITYMRTDSFSVSQEAVQACREFVTNKIGKEYCPEKPNFFKSRSTAQEAHEAIRPTDVARTPESLKRHLEPAQWKVYSLIWERFVASQMTRARIEQRSAEVEAVPAPDRPTSYLFRASCSEVTFLGYMKVSGTEMAVKDENGDAVDQLPDLKEGEPLECLEWLSERKETTPPSRYSEASLVKELERNGVGRPSTYAQTIATLSQREYVTREKRSLAATDLGMQVNGLLTESLDKLFNVKFTASMESALDAVEKGECEWTSMLSDFYERFSKWMESTRAPGADQETVAKILAGLEHVKEWAPQVKRGRRTYSDERFVESIKRDVANSGKELSARQCDALIRIACHYRDQSPEIRRAIEETGHGDLLRSPEFQPPRESTLEKLKILEGLELDDSASNFVGSLRARAKGNRSLSPAQLKALNNIVLSHAGQIENFDSMRQALEIEHSEVESDEEGGPLLEAMRAVKEWKPPVVRGKRVFNDKTFFESLQKHHSSKGFLSVRQRAALRKMVQRYASQIPDYDKLAEQLNLRRSKRSKEVPAPTGPEAAPQPGSPTHPAQGASESASDAGARNSEQ